VLGRVSDIGVTLTSPTVALSGTTDKFNETKIVPKLRFRMMAQTKLIRADPHLEIHTCQHRQEFFLAVSLVPNGTEPARLALADAASCRAP